jgi:5-methylcytosine-specific restriction endonuclease McrA
MQHADLKKCSACNIEKAFEAFRKSERGLHGLHSVCRVCANIKAKEYQAKNRASVLLKKKEHRAKNQDKIQNYMVGYRAENKEKLRRQTQKYRQANSTLLREKARVYASLNPLQRRAAESRRRAKMSGANGTHTAADIRVLHGKQRYKCACCGTDTTTKYHVDHIIPLALNGSNDLLNLQILCPKCNTQKSAKHPIDFMQEKGFLL